MSEVILQKLTVPQLVRKFPARYGTQLFITTLTTARCLSVSWSQIPPFHTPHLFPLIFILRLSSHLQPGLPSRQFPSGLPHGSPACIFLLLHARQTSRTEAVALKIRGG